MSLDELRRRAGKFQRRIYWRNAREYVAALAVVAFFAFELWRRPGAAAAAGYGLIIAGLLYVVWQLHRRGSSRTMPAQMGLATGVDFYRLEMERQRDMLARVWRWYLAPLVPGLAVVMAQAARTNPHHLPHYGWFAAAYAVLVAAGFYFIAWLNARAARRLQRCIDELDALRAGR